MGQEQKFIKDCTLILGLSSRSGSTCLFSILCPQRSPCRWHYPGAPGQTSLGRVWPLESTGKRWKGCGAEKGWGPLLAGIEYSSHRTDATGFPPLFPSVPKSWYLNIICQFPYRCPHPSKKVISWILFPARTLSDTRTFLMPGILYLYKIFQLQAVGLIAISRFTHKHAEAMRG